MRPEAVTVAATTEDDAATSSSAGVVGHVLASAFLGPISRLSVDVGDHGLVVAQLPTSQALDHPVGSRVRVTLRPEPVLVTADSK